MQCSAESSTSSIRNIYVEDFPPDFIVFSYNIKIQIELLIVKGDFIFNCFTYYVNQEIQYILIVERVQKCTWKKSDYDQNIFKSELKVLLTKMFNRGRYE